MGAGLHALRLSGTSWISFVLWINLKNMGALAFECSSWVLPSPLGKTEIVISASLGYSRDSAGKCGRA